jgi:ubiquinone/menaquinone biosynthesis C-methylase UbiE
METVSQKEIKNPAKNCCREFQGLINYSQPQTDEVCVVIGSGAGQDAIEIAREVGSNGYVYGIELSGELIKKAYDRAELEGITNVDFVHGHIENLKINSEVAHLVLSDCSLSNSVSREEAWKEIYRVLKKSGRFIVSDIYLKHETESITGCREKALSRAAYIELLYHAGFASVRIIKENKSTDGIAGFIVAGEKPGESRGLSCRM